MKNLKRYAAFFLILALICMTAAGPGTSLGAVYSDEHSVDNDISFDALEVVAAQQKTSLDSLSAKSAVLIEAGTGTVLFEKNAYEHRPIASVTKVMSMLLIMEAIDQGRLTYHSEVTVSQYAADMGGSQAYIEAGEIFTVDEMLKAIAVHSSNDVTVSLAEAVAGGELEFVSAMNEKAAALGLENTYFNDCTGLNDDQYSCAYDVAVISRELLTKHPDIIRYTSIWHDTFRNGTFNLDNTNKLIKFYNGCDGLKTGYTSAAGFNLSATAERGGMRLISVVLGEPDSKTRFAESSKLMDHGFANFERFTGVEQSEWPRYVKVKRGVSAEVAAAPSADSYIVINKGMKSGIKADTILNEEIKAPVACGAELGRVTLTYEGEEIGSYPICAADDVGEITYGWTVGRLFKYWGEWATHVPI